jgi:ABC-type multidrug transport system fused ATPase/permease subunit
MIQYWKKFLFVFPSNKLILIPWSLAFVGTSIIEAFGIGIVGPYIELVSNPNLIFQNPALENIYNLTGVGEVNHFIGLVGLLLLLLFGLKSLLVWFVQVRIIKFSCIQRQKLVQKMLRAYMTASYESFISKNSASIIQNILEQTAQFSNGILLGLFRFLSNILTVLAISLLLCLYSPVSVFSLILIGMPLALMFKLSKQRMKKSGEEMYVASQGIIRSVNHGLGGFKETQIIGCGEFFKGQALNYSRQYTDAAVKYSALQYLPRYAVEFLLISFLVCFLSISLFIGQNIEQVVSTLGVFALASFRLLPAFIGVANGFAELSRSIYGLNQMYLELQDQATPDKDPSRLFEHTLNPYSKSLNKDLVKRLAQQDISQNIKFERYVSIRNITYKYPNSSGNALENISIDIPKGKSIALIGKSGAGKTTLVDVILGFLHPQQGDIEVDGNSIYNGDLKAWQRLIGYIPQSIFLIDDTLERNIAFGVPDHEIDQQRLQKAIAAAQLTEVVQNLPHGLNTRVGERGVMLSGGQRQRVGIARVLYHEREILVLDKATSALDNETEHLVTESIKALSGIKTVIVIAHRLTTIEHCDRVYLLEKGKIKMSGQYHEVVRGESRMKTQQKGHF